MPKYHMRHLRESSWEELYQSAVDAFPETTRRQYATDPIEIANVTVVPFIGFKTLFIRSRAMNEEREYGPMVLAKGVVYQDHRRPGSVQIEAADGVTYFLEPLSLENSNILLRCNCADFYWRFNYFNHLDRTLYGRVRAPYQAANNPGSANPNEMQGACKHLMKMVEVLSNSGIIR